MPYPDPLRGAQFKTVWARQHLDTLKRDIRAYLDLKPYSFFVHHHSDGSVVVSPPKVTLPPPLALSGLVGDCLCAMMACLDYIIWELASKHAGRLLVPPPIGNDKPSFPLFIDPDRFQKWIPSMKRYHVPADAIAEIEAVQPYDAGYEPLFVLYQLVNQDKHRLPVLAVGHMTPSDINVTVAGVSAVDAFTPQGATLKTELLPKTPDDKREVEMYTHGTPFVALGDLPMPWEPVEVTLEKILVCVTDIFMRAHGFFF
jgi:hypothetical protein